MSFDDLETFYHLTPHGWIEGEERYFGNLERVPKPIPEDRVETWKRHETQASEWSRVDIDFICVWASEKVSRTERDALRVKYPMPTTERMLNPKIGEPL
jgi:hypothetical protein